MRLKKRYEYSPITISAVLTLCLLHFFAIPINAIEEVRAPISMEEVSKIEEAGTYPVRVIIDSNKGVQVEQIIYITITQESTTISEQYSEAIDAKPLRISKKTFDTITTAEIIQRSNARAWSTKDGSKIDITDVEKLEANTGKQHIRLSTNKGTTMIISAIISSELETEYQANHSKNVLTFSLFSRQRIVVLYTISLLLFPLISILLLFSRISKQALKISSVLYKAQKEGENT